jgi:tRNA pseudouridine38-40 synthase
MRTLKLAIAYDGTNYAGWQIQRMRNGAKPTIQGTLERVLQQILQEPARIVGSGRTDAGVHALAQVAHVRTHSSIPCERLKQALNGLLPADIAVTEVVEAGKSFHARFDARTKRYRYQLCNRPVVLPFLRRYVHQVRHPLNVALMRREARTLLGRRDVRAFHKASRPVSDATRIISDVLVRRHDGLITIEIEANGFLHAMVRGIVGTLIEIGRGHRPPGTIRRILTTKDRRLVGPTAPSKGLWLIGVTY